jgi:hypothetical protein
MYDNRIFRDVRRTRSPRTPFPPFLCALFGFGHLRSATPRHAAPLAVEAPKSPDRDFSDGKAMSSSSSSASASAGAATVHMHRLRESHARMLSSWKALLTSNPNEAALALAFGKLLEEYPDAKRLVPGREETMLSLALPRLFPSLSSLAPDVVERIVMDFLEVMTANTQVRVGSRRVCANPGMRNANSSRPFVLNVRLSSLLPLPMRPAGGDADHRR